LFNYSLFHEKIRFKMIRRPSIIVDKILERRGKMKVKVPGEGEVVIPDDELKRLRKLLKETQQLKTPELEAASLAQLTVMALSRGIGKLEDELARAKLQQKRNDIGD